MVKRSLKCLLGIATNVKRLYAGGDFGELIFNIPLTPNRRTKLDLTTSAPLA